MKEMSAAVAREPLYRQLMDRILAQVRSGEWSPGTRVPSENELVARYDKDYPLKFYSPEFLFSDEARAKFVEGDLKTIFSEITDN